VPPRAGLSRPVCAFRIVNVSRFVHRGRLPDATPRAQSEKLITRDSGDLIDANPDFRALVEKSGASPRKPFVPKAPVTERKTVSKVARHAPSVA